VAGEGVVEVEGPPHLRKPGVDVEEHAAGDGVEDRRVVAVAHHVDEAGRGPGPLDHLGPRDAEHRFAPIDVERERAVEAESSHQVEKAPPLDRLGERGRCP